LGGGSNGLDSGQSSPDAIPNTGGGGGGDRDLVGGGSGHGASGIVLVRYKI
jgi:hypothetical protein